jgi:hypothetical protein
MAGHHRGGSSSSYRTEKYDSRHSDQAFATSKGKAPSEGTLRTKKRSHSGSAFGRSVGKLPNAEAQSSNPKTSLIEDMEEFPQVDLNPKKRMIAEMEALAQHSSNPNKSLIEEVEALPQADLNPKKRLIEEMEALPQADLEEVLLQGGLKLDHGGKIKIAQKMCPKLDLFIDLDELECQFCSASENLLFLACCFRAGRGRVFWCRGCIRDDIRTTYHQDIEKHQILPEISFHLLAKHVSRAPMSSNIEGPIAEDDIGDEVVAVEVAAAVAFNPPDVAEAGDRPDGSQRNDDLLLLSAEAEPNDGSNYIGSNFVKFFDQLAYIGKVVEWLPQTNMDQAMWHVVYHDLVSSEIPFCRTH